MKPAPPDLFNAVCVIVMALNLFGLFGTVLQPFSYQMKMQQQNPKAKKIMEELEQYMDKIYAKYPGGKWGVIIIATTSLLLNTFLVFKMWRGTYWARKAYIIFFIIMSIISISLAFSSDPFLGLITIPSIIVQLFVIWVITRKEVTAYLQKVSFPDKFISEPQVTEV